MIFNFIFVLKEYLFDFFKNFYKSNSLCLTECIKLLPKEEQKMFKELNIIIEEK